MGQRSDRVRLGEVTVPSGVLVLVDAGLLGIWDGSRDDLPPTADLRIEGPDADEFGRRSQYSSHPRYWYDVPLTHVDETKREVDAFALIEGLDVRLAEIPDGISHRRRIDLALEHGGGRFGILEFFGVHAPVVAGLRRDCSFSVYGVPMSDAEFDDRWRWITIEFDEGEPATTEAIGDVFVDEARLMFADADALQEWRHQDSLDGKADFVFWGRDAEAAAALLAAPPLEPDVYGWVDVPVAEAVERGQSVENAKEARSWLFATDFRPHSHHHWLLEEMRSSATGSGMLEVGGAKLCGFFTSWGDGVFPVTVDLSRGGDPQRLWIDLGNEETIERLRQLMA